MQSEIEAIFLATSVTKMLDHNNLELLLTEIPKHVDDDNLKFLDELLPWSPRVQKECPSRYKKK